MQNDFNPLNALVELFQQGKIYSYNDGENLWIVLDSYNYVSDFMNVFEMDNYGDIILKAFFKKDEIYFLQEEVFENLDFTYQDIYQEIKNSQ